MGPSPARTGGARMASLISMSGTGVATPDLRRAGCAFAVARAEHELGVRLDAARAVVKRRTWSALSDRGTWVRLQVWPVDHPAVDHVPGVVAASALVGVPRPAWYRGVHWAIDELLWRADELEFVTQSPVIPAGTVTVEPCLSDGWWRDMACALDAVATTVAQLPQQTVTQRRFTDRIAGVFGADVDTAVAQWGGVHGDMAFANLTAPELCLLDWEEFGCGPVGLDHARLWADSLAVPGLAARCATEFAAYLDTWQGLLCCAYSVVPLLDLPAGEPLRAPAECAAQHVAEELRAGAVPGRTPLSGSSQSAPGR